MAVRNLCSLLFILVALAYCSVDSDTKTNNTFKDKLLSKRDVFQVQNLFAANCENIKEEIFSVKTELTAQNQQLQCLVSSLDEIYDVVNHTSENLDKQNSLIDNLANSVESLNEKLADQDSKMKTVVNDLENQEDKIKTLTALLTKLVSGENETSSNDTNFSCPEDFKDFNGNCYKYYELTKTRSGASDICRAAGGHLAEPRTEAEDRFIDLEVLEGKAGANGPVHLGGIYHISGGVWILPSDGAIISYGFTNWLEGYPVTDRVYDDFCIYFGRDDWQSNGWWWPGHCDVPVPFVCQTPKISPL